MLSPPIVPILPILPILCPADAGKAGVRLNGYENCKLKIEN